MNHRYVLLLFPLFTIPFFSELPFWIFAVSFSLWGLAIGNTYRFIFKMSPILLKILTLSFTFLIYREFKSILGPEAGTSLILILLSLKFHELNKKGDVMTVNFTYFILVMNSLLFSQTLFTTLYMFFLIFGIIYAFMSLDSPEKSIKEIWNKSPKMLSYDTLFVIPIFLAMFFLFPRFNVSLGNLVAPPKTTVGFSGNLTPGEMADLATSEGVAFRVVFDNVKVNPKELYWRGQVLTQTDGFNWKRNLLRNPQSRDENSLSNLIKYNLVIEPKYQKTLFLLDNPIDAEWTDASRNKIQLLEDTSFETQFPLIARSYYRGTSSLTNNIKGEKIDRAEFTELPNDLPKRVRDLAQKLKGESDQETYQNILKFFKDEKFSYTLTTPKMTIENFLFDTKSGFCEHFASSYAVLARAAGIPSRVIIGFQGGEYNEFGDYMIVKEKFAHAWTELWLENKGWVRVDPTAIINQVRIETGGQQMDPGETTELSSFSKLWLKTSLLVDTINNSYMLFMMRYNYNKQLEILEKLGLKNMTRWKIYAGLLTLIFVILIAWIYIQKKWELKKDKLSEAYLQLVSEIEKLGVKKEIYEGPLTFADKISDAEAQQLLLEYANIRYASETTHTESFIVKTKNYSAKKLQP